MNDILREKLKAELPYLKPEVINMLLIFLKEPRIQAEIKRKYIEAIESLDPSELMNKAEKILFNLELAACKGMAKDNEAVSRLEKAILESKLKRSRQNLTDSCLEAKDTKVLDSQLVSNYGLNINFFPPPIGQGEESPSTENDKPSKYQRTK